MAGSAAAVEQHIQALLTQSVQEGLLDDQFLQLIQLQVGVSGCWRSTRLDRLLLRIMPAACTKRPAAAADALPPMVMPTRVVPVAG